MFFLKKWLERKKKIIENKIIYSIYKNDNVFFRKIKDKLIKFLIKEIFYINSSTALPEPLSKEEEAKVLQKIVSGELKNREVLIVHNLRLVVYIAKKFEYTHQETEDLVSIGTVGLIKAVNTFCPEKNIKLATYASKCIENEILMYLRKVSSLKSETSIDEPFNVDNEGGELLFSDILGSEIDAIETSIERESEGKALKDMINNLSNREKVIIQMRFGLNGKKELTQKEVATTLGISQSYISRLEKKIIFKLKKDMERVC